MKHIISPFIISLLAINPAFTISIPNLAGYYNINDDKNHREILNDPQLLHYYLLDTEQQPMVCNGSSTNLSHLYFSISSHFLADEHHPLSDNISMDVSLY